jgi:hypothetical protein
VCISGESGSERCWLLPSKRLPEQAVDEAIARIKQILSE